MNECYQEIEAERKKNDVIYQVIEKMNAGILKILLRNVLRKLELELGKNYEKLTVLRSLSVEESKFADWIDVKEILVWASEQNDHHLLLYLWFGLLFVLPQTREDIKDKVTNREAFIDFWIPEVLVKGFDNRFLGIDKQPMNENSYVEGKLPMKAFVLDLTNLYCQICMTRPEWVVKRHTMLENGGKKHAIDYVPKQILMLE